MNYYFTTLYKKVDWGRLAVMILIALVLALIGWLVNDCSGGHEVLEAVVINGHDYEPPWEETYTTTDDKGNMHFHTNHHDAVYTLLLDRHDREPFEYQASLLEYHRWPDGTKVYLKMRVGKSGAEYSHKIVPYFKHK